MTCPTEADVIQMTVDDISQMDERCSTTSYVDNDTDATCILNSGGSYYDNYQNSDRSFAEAGCLATFVLYFLLCGCAMCKFIYSLRRFFAM